MKIRILMGERTEGRSKTAPLQFTAKRSRPWRQWGILFSFAGGALSFGAEPLLLLNGHIHTGVEAQPRAEAVLVAKGRITFVGTEKQARAKAPEEARIIDLHGRTLLSGFVDAHAHLVGIGFRELDFNLEGTGSVAELQAKLKERAAQTALAGGWIVGRGWIETKWTPPQFPTRADLDTVVPLRPVVLTRADGHALIANSRALQFAGITAKTPNPNGGEILRDVHGEPTGMLIDRAMDLVRRLVPAPTAAETARAIEVGAERELRLGWTQVHVAGGSLDERWALEQAQSKLRLYVAVTGPGMAAEKLIRDGAQIGDRFTARTIKLFIDGALGSRGAALLEPYADAPGSRGLVMNTEDGLLPLLTSALRAGIQIETHAIGDRGNRIMLDLYEKALAAVPPAERKVAEPRWRIEHAQILHADDIPRFARLGVIASMQPSHAIGDLYFAPARLGAGSPRLAGAYAWRTLLDAGAKIAGGSDAPVERGEPLIEFYAAVTRKSLDGFANDDWHRELRVTRAEALKMFTLWPAYASFEEKQRGTIEAGKAADFTVFSADIMEIPEPEILKAECVMTIVGGEVAWERK